METWRFMSEAPLSDGSVGGFLDLPRQFGPILTSKEHNRRNILPVELAGSTLV